MKGKVVKTRGKERNKLYATRKADRPFDIKKVKDDYLKAFLAK